MGCLVFFIFFCVVVAFISFITVGAYKKQENKRHVWQEAAKDLSLRYTPGSLNSPGQISGKIGAHRIVVDSYATQSGSNKITFTRYRVYYPKELGLGLKLTHQRNMNVYRNSVEQDIKIGDDAFDRDVVVKGKDPGEIRGFLNSGRCDLIHKLMGRYGNICIEDSNSTIKTLSVENNPQVLIKTVKHLVSLATSLTAKPKEKPVPPPAPEKAPKPEPPPVTVEESPVELAPEAFDEQLEQAAFDVEQSQVELQTAEVQQEIEDLAQQEPEQPEEEQAVNTPAEPEETKEHQEKLSAADRIKQVVKEKGLPEPKLTQKVEIKQEEINDVLAVMEKAQFDAGQFCDYLFDGSVFNLDLIKKFEPLAGQEVKWQGVLEQSQKYFSDFTFKDSKGTKGIFKIHEIIDKFSSISPVKAIVQLPPEAHEKISNRRGQQLSFSGKLLKIDTMSKEIYIADGSITES